MSTNELAIDKKLSDFPAQLSPMVVKELRQGMRTHLFTIAFILLQTMMIFCLLLGLAPTSSNGSTEFFWFLIILTLLFIQPLRGFSALSQEYQLNTMDLIQLTRLDAWRITLGKWFALNAQGLLFAVGVLPYVVMRYFLSQVDIIAELGLIGVVMLGSLVGTAITIGCSVFRNVILRGCIMIGVFIGAWASVAAISFSNLTGSRGPSAALLTMVAVACLYSTFFFLSFGAARISPLAENHATRMRIGSLLFCALLTLFFFWDLKMSVFVVSFIVMAFACIDAFTAPEPIYDAVMPSFLRVPGSRLVAWFLAPGPVTAFGFFVVGMSLCAGQYLLCDRIHGTVNLDLVEKIVHLFSLANAVALPTLTTSLIFRKPISFTLQFVFYASTQGVLLIISLLSHALIGVANDHKELIYSIA
ncbi:MAG: hypothetical protein AAF236_17010, partial [Verrucomicrobiota bacterium]